MHSMWIDGVEARQQHDDKINEAGHHRRRGGGRGSVKRIDSGSAYEVYPHKNHHHRNRDNVSHRNAFPPNAMGGEGAGGGNGSGNGHGNKRRDRSNDNPNGHQRKHRHRKRNRSNNSKENLSLWINEEQLKMLTGKVWPWHNWKGAKSVLKNMCFS